MAQTIDEVPVSDLPLAPINPLPYRQKVRAIRAFHTGVETLRDAGGPVTRLRLGPTWLMPPVVVATSPQSARDVLSRSGEHAGITRVHHETRHLFGPSLFDLTHKPWLSRRRTLQPIFTKQHVRNFGGHMAQAAQIIVDNWGDDTQIDLDTECRKLTLRALGRSVLGLDLAEHTDSLAKPVRYALEYVADRAVQPLRAPRWLPTLARHRARSSSNELHRLAGQILQSCRSDPSRDAPLVQALIAARDLATGQALSDDEIRTELVSFMVAGHETTATTLAYALWALGRHPEIQDRVRTEVTGIGDRELTPEDGTSLRYTVQVLHEALRLCPAAATTARTAMRDIEVGGYRVEAGTMLVVGIYALHRDPTLWDNPLNFDPDRFNPQNSTGRDRWQYLPFGAGPRSCIGDHFAMLEATLALATIIRSIDIKSMDPEFPIIVPFTTIAAAPIRARANVISRGLRR
jgi:cytochrome P450